MIKRIRFADRSAGADAPFAAAWRDAVARALDAPGDARPTRLAACTVLPDVTPQPKHPGIGLEWFRDADHLARYEAWCTSTGKGGPGIVVVAEEHVLRGGDWLSRRWHDGGPKLKHMALAARADGLTPSEFRTRWRNHAGAAGSTPIPDAARGLAYAQNHPLPRDHGEWAYDAVNEVWFDDLDALRARLVWFATRDGEADRDLFGESWFLAVREDVLTDGAAESGL